MKTKTRYWVIETDTNDAKGPFNYVADAESWIKEDTKQAFEGVEQDLSDKALAEYSGDYIIVEEKKRVKPVPVVSVKVRLDEVEG